MSYLPAIEARLMEMPSVIIERGRQYWNKRRLLGIDAVPTRKGSAWQANVQGSERQPYEVYLHFDDKDQLRQSHCSCPMGGDCKHEVVALLALMLLEKDGNDNDAPSAPVTAAPGTPPVLPYELMQAREWLDSAGALSAKQRTGKEDSLVYVLERNPRKPSVLTMQVFRAQQRPDGTYHKPKPWRGLEQASIYSPPSFVAPVDIPFIQAAQRWRIERNQWQLRADDITLEGTMGHTVLMAAMATGRCHWQDLANPPLGLGSRQSSHFDWIEHDGLLGITLPDCPPPMIPVATQPPLVLDPDQHTLSPLDTGVPDMLAMQLLNMPALRTRVWVELWPQLRTVCEMAGLAMPTVGNAPREIIGCLPLPYLHFTMWHGTVDRKRVSWPIAQLRADYEGFQCRPQQPGRQLNVTDDDGQVLLIERDMAAEHRWVEELRPLQTLHLLLGWQAPEGESRFDMALRDPADWPRFFHNRLPTLLNEGWQISYADDFPFRMEDVGDSGWYGSLEEGSGNAWFALEMGIEVDGERISLVPLLVQALEHMNPRQREAMLQIDDDKLDMHLMHGNRLLRVPVGRMRPLLQVLVDIFDRETQRPALTADGALKLPRMDAARLAVHSDVPWKGGQKLLELGKQLEGFAGLETVSPPATLKAELRPYQQTGLDWLQFLRRHELGGVLADDMGLGKTVQALAHLTVEKNRRRLRKPALIVCPKSLLPNWRNEAARFAPGLRVLCISGLRREALLEQIPDHDLVITTYPLLARDVSVMSEHEFSVCICDEAQQLKNHKTKTAIAVRALNAEQRLALTGTPMENHLGELWSLFDWLQPGLLGSEADFRRLYRNPVEKHGDVTMAQRLARRVKPFLLRRTKQEVATELPPKTEIRQAVEITGAQRDLYETVRVTMDKKVREAIAKKGLARSSIEVLEALLKLRQVCCDPRLLNESAESAKLEMLLDMLPEMIEDGRRILL
ncbi:MAG: SNF2-related protein, partial [Moraxellaceae bacterium]|nr:SNF2-related protein [Moraxellaceae bacterium]